MRALVLPAFGLEHLSVGDLPPPEPLPPDSVRVRIQAVSLNYRDLLVVQGKYDPRFQLPLVPCSDACGVVEAVGSGVRGLERGTRVIPSFAPGWLDGPPERASARRTLGGPLPGTACEEIVLPASAFVTAPEHLDDVQASTLACAATTAYRALFELSDEPEPGPSLEGRWVLCQGTGGVSLFALQLAKAAGARVIVTSSSDEKLEVAKALGADATIHRRREEHWGAAARDLSGGGVHQVIDVGGSGTLEQSLKAARMGGTISMIGALGSGTPRSLLPAVMNQIRLQGVLVGSRSTLAKTVELTRRCGIVPHVHRTLSLERAIEAFALLETGQHVGKVCMTVR